MKILRDWQAKHQAKKETKKQALRLKNAKLRAAGKEPLKGWGKMVDTGIGGANKANPIDTKETEQTIKKTSATVPSSDCCRGFFKYSILCLRSLWYAHA